MRSIFQTAAVALVAAFTLVPAAATHARPNVILIMADDFGYECVGANGGTSYKTPHLDRLAADGVRFTHCYVQPLCTPTRVQLMTGKYNVRNYVDVRQHGPAGDDVRQPVQAGRLRDRASPASGSSAATSSCRRSSASTNIASGSTPAGRRAMPTRAWRSTASRRTSPTASTAPTSSTTTRSTSSRGTRTSRSSSTTR